jgi:hypothetical protein
MNKQNIYRAVWYEGFRAFQEHIVSRRTVAMQRSRNERIYRDRFWATARETRSRSNRHEPNSGRPVFSMWSVPRCYKQGIRLELSSAQECVKKVLEPGGRGIATFRAIVRKRLVTD